MGKTLRQFVNDNRPQDFGSWTWPELWPMIEPAIGRTLVKEERQVDLNSGPEAGQTITIIEIKRSEIAWSFDFYDPPHNSRSEMEIRNGRPLGESVLIRFGYSDLVDEKSGLVTYRLNCSAISGWLTDFDELCRDIVDAICRATGMELPQQKTIVELPKPVAWLRAPRWVTEEDGDGKMYNGPVALCFADELEPITQNFIKSMAELTGYNLGIDLHVRSY